MKEWARYGLSIAVYIGISFYTKRLLTWTHGPLYFITTLEVLPRTYRRLRGRSVSSTPLPEAIQAQELAADS